MKLIVFFQKGRIQNCRESQEETGELRIQADKATCSSDVLKYVEREADPGMVFGRLEAIERLGEGEVADYVECGKLQA